MCSLLTRPHPTLKAHTMSCLSFAGHNLLTTTEYKDTVSGIITTALGKDMEVMKSEDKWSSQVRCPACFFSADAQAFKRPVYLTGL